ncbi:hypothetical protein ACJJTC_011959 [Scirpophaga incertulas]
MCSKTRRGRRDKAEQSADPSHNPSADGFRIRCHSSATVRDITTHPASHGSAMRQVVSGKVFKKCKSATFQIDGATYTIGEFRRRLWPWRHRYHFGERHSISFTGKLDSRCIIL